MNMFNKFFGKEKAKEIVENKNSQIQGLFDNLAQDYDRMNNFISFGRHLTIKKKAVKRVPIHSNSVILDLCTGTGDIARLIAERYPDTRIIGADFSQNMLDIAEKKSKKFKNIEYIKANALCLPFEDNTFDLCFISFGLRNLSDLKQGIIEMKRVVKNNGYIVNIDLGKPKSNLSGIIRLYFNIVVPILGKLIHGHFTPYQYLPESNESFPSQGELVKIFQELGFTEVENYNYAFGSVAQQIAKVKKTEE